VGNDGGMIGNVLGSIPGQFAQGGTEGGPPGAGPVPGYTWEDWYADVLFDRSRMNPGVKWPTPGRETIGWNIPGWFLQQPYAPGATYQAEGTALKGGTPASEMTLSPLAVRSLAKLFPALEGQVASRVAPFVNQPSEGLARPEIGGSPWWFLEGGPWPGKYPPFLPTTTPPTPMPEEASAQAMRNIRTSGGLPAFRGYMEGPQKTPWEAYLAQIQGAWPAAQKKRPATRRPARQQ